ncbi:MAG TPA: hypothetical protein VGL08_06745 [Paraburkholderia sp.]|jgi:hypothetical protein
MKRTNNFSHLANCTPVQWEQVRTVLNAPALAAGWAKAFKRIGGKTATAKDNTRTLDFGWQKALAIAAKSTK